MGDAPGSGGFHAYQVRRAALTSQATERFRELLRLSLLSAATPLAIYVDREFDRRVPKLLLDPIIVAPPSSAIRANVCRSE